MAVQQLVHVVAQPATQPTSFDNSTIGHRTSPATFQAALWVLIRLGRRNGFDCISHELNKKAGPIESKPKGASFPEFSSNADQMVKKLAPNQFIMETKV